MVILSYLLGSRVQRKRYFVLITIATIEVSLISAFIWVEVPYHTGASGFAVPLSFPFIVLETVESVQINFLSIKLVYVHYALPIYAVAFMVFSFLLLFNITGATVGYWIKDNDHIERLIKGFERIEPGEFRQRKGITGFIICLSLLTTLVSFVFKLSETTSETVYGFPIPLMRTSSYLGITINVVNFIGVTLLYFTFHSMLTFWFFRVKRKELRERACIEMIGFLAILIITVEEILIERGAIQSWADLQIFVLFLILAIIFLIINAAWAYQQRHRKAKREEETHISTDEDIDKFIIQKINENPQITNLDLIVQLKKHGINISLEELAKRRDKLE